MSDPYKAPAGEPTRPLPAYRPAGPQAGMVPARPAQTVYTPVPSRGASALPAQLRPQAGQTSPGAGS